MSWGKGDLIVYHGTTDGHADLIRRNGVDPTTGRTITDFGRGFYTTTSFTQARDWANKKQERHGAGNAAVMQFTINRDWLSGLRSLVFVIEVGTAGYWDFVD